MTMTLLSNTALLHRCVRFQGVRPAMELLNTAAVTAGIPTCFYHRLRKRRTHTSENFPSYLTDNTDKNILRVPPQSFTPQIHIQTLINSHANCSRNILSTHKNISLPYSVQRKFSINTRTILQSSPPFLQPYLRLIRFDRPIGSYLLFWPCTWSIGLSATAGHLPDLYILSLFAAGSFFMRGAGCIINDMWDKDFDRKVERTKMRPLASGELSQFQALYCLGLNLGVSLAILLQLNSFSIALGASSMILVVLYPLAKRFTNWPQIVLGLTFNYGAMLGWCAVRGTLDWPILPLYASCLAWTLVYDTIYAHQDKYDDMLIGVKSTALTLGDKTKPWLAGFSTVMVSSLALTGVLCDQTWPYYTALTATAAHLAYQLYTVNLNDPDDCFAKFKSNSRLGLVMFLGIVAGTLLKPSESGDSGSRNQSESSS